MDSRSADQHPVANRADTRSQGSSCAAGQTLSLEDHAVETVPIASSPGAKGDPSWGRGFGFHRRHTQRAPAGAGRPIRDTDARLAAVRALRPARLRAVSRRSLDSGPRGSCERGTRSRRSTGAIVTQPEPQRKTSSPDSTAVCVTHDAADARRRGCQPPGTSPRARDHEAVRLMAPPCHAASSAAGSGSGDSRGCGLDHDAIRPSAIDHARIGRRAMHPLTRGTSSSIEDAVIVHRTTVASRRRAACRRQAETFRR